MPIARHRGTLAQAHSSQPPGLRLVRTVALFRLRHEDRQGCLRDASAWRTWRSPDRLLRSSEAVVNSVSSILYLAGTGGTRHSVATRFRRHHACGYSQQSMPSGTCNDAYIRQKHLTTPDDGHVRDRTRPLAYRHPRKC